jgi:hypothetical protein
VIEKPGQEFFVRLARSLKGRTVRNGYPSLGSGGGVARYQ